MYGQRPNIIFNMALRRTENCMYESNWDKTCKDENTNFFYMVIVVCYFDMSNLHVLYLAQLCIMDLFKSIFVGNLESIGYRAIGNLDKYMACLCIDQMTLKKSCSDFYSVQQWDIPVFCISGPDPQFVIASLSSINSHVCPCKCFWHVHSQPLFIYKTYLPVQFNLPNQFNPSVQQAAYKY